MAIDRLARRLTDLLLAALRARAPRWALLIALAAGLAGIPNPARAAGAKPLDWDAITREATGFLSKYIQINTTNPPGNELAAAKFLK